MSAVESWTSKVQAHHDQPIRTQNESSWSAGDFREPIVSDFRADPHRTDDLVLDRIRRDVGGHMTVIDVGGGAGRFALPLALHCKHVTVVEPSESMIEALREEAAAVGVENLSIVQGLWGEADVDRADLVLCAHVVYGLTEIEPFVRKLESSARGMVVILAFADSPLSQLSPLWEHVHGEKRIDMPALPELMEVLWEMGIYPDLEMLEETVPVGAENRDKALEMLRHFLFVKPDTDQDRRLQNVMEELLVETPAGLVVRGARPRRQGLVFWRRE